MACRAWRPSLNLAGAGKNLRLQREAACPLGLPCRSRAVHARPTAVQISLVDSGLAGAADKAHIPQSRRARLLFQKSVTVSTTPLPRPGRRKYRWSGVLKVTGQGLAHPAVVPVCPPAGLIGVDDRAAWDALQYAREFGPRFASNSQSGFQPVDLSNPELLRPAIRTCISSQDWVESSPAVPKGPC